MAIKIAQSDDLVLVSRALLGAANYIIRKSDYADSNTARAMKAAAMQDAHTTYAEIAANERSRAAIEANRERDEA